MADSSDDRLQPISELGEDALIQRLTRGFAPDPGRVLVPPGDDAAVMHSGGPEELVLTTDLLVEGVHFDLRYVPLHHLGYKAVAVNVSDVLAMNARPDAITVSLAASSRIAVQALDALYEGIHQACKDYGLSLLGGDTTSSRQGLLIAVSAYGRAPEPQLVRRSGGRENDVLLVSGDLGAAYAGLQVLEREKEVYLQNPGVQPDLSDYDYALGRQLRPVARQDVIQQLADAKLQPTAMMDLSDGLVTDLHRLAAASGTGAMLYQDHLPVHEQTKQAAADFDQAAALFALHGGEDYELLLTLPAAAYQAHREALSLLTPIGFLTPRDQGLRMTQSDGSVVELAPMGFRHFSEEGE